MSDDNLYRDLCSKMGLVNSESLFNVWQTLCTVDEARVALMLPGHVDELAARSGGAPARMNEVLTSLFKKGAVFKSQRDGKTVYKLAKNIIQFHDASILWDNADQNFFDMWKRVMDEDFAGMMRSLPESVKLPSFMRVIPIDEHIRHGSAVLPYEECVHLVSEAEQLAVVKCPCRLSQQNCDAPIEACIQLNRGAEYALDRGHGRQISLEEALDILKKSEEAGLVHLAENKGYGNVICNCCSCCCEMFRLKDNSQKEWILSPSRYHAVVDASLCTACGLCLDTCPVDAITLGDVSEIETKLCIGCGLCAANCPEKAILLVPVREEQHIPVK